MQGKRVIRKTEGPREANNSRPVKMTNEKEENYLVNTNSTNCSK